MKTVDISISSKYKVYIGKGIRKDIIKYFDFNSYGRLFLITDENVNRLYGREMEAYLQEGKRDLIKYIIPPGEGSKSLSMVENILEFMAENHLRRSDLLIAFGGGVVGDLGGFIAGIYQRGMDYLQVATSLLAAVDSSVGGKTAVNLRNGKNLAGLFNQPIGVICDLDFFQSLGHDEFSNGLAEIIKYGILFDEDLFHRMEEGFGPNSSDLAHIVEKSIIMKRDIVGKDEYDLGKRHLLNLGHTIGHGIEGASNYKISHGHAVAMGIGIMARACGRSGITMMEVARAIEKVLRIHGLATNTDYSPDLLMDYIKKDKKSDGNDINVILIEDIGRCLIKRLTFKELKDLMELGVVDI